MNALAIAVILLLRVAVPLGILLSIGEWVRRREEKYWLRK
jgi:hypothetical protein